VKQKGAGVSPPISPGTETFFFAPGGTVKHPVTGKVMSPRPLDAAYRPEAGESDPRRALVDSLIAADNPYFAPAAVNRVWANFFGRGLVEPVDDFRISNPSVNSPLLTALAQDFAAHGYDLKHLMRTIMASRLYQLSSKPNEHNLADTPPAGRSVAGRGQRRHGRMGYVRRHAAGQPGDPGLELQDRVAIHGCVQPARSEHGSALRTGHPHQRRAIAALDEFKGPPDQAQQRQRPGPPVGGQR
jgi:hypothetical protein